MGRDRGVQKGRGWRCSDGQREEVEVYRWVEGKVEGVLVSGTHQPFWAPSHMVGAVLLAAPDSSPLSSVSWAVEFASSFGCPASLWWCKARLLFSGGLMGWF